MDEKQRLLVGNRLFRAVTVLTGLFVLFAVWILVSTPNPSSISGCLVTERHSVSLCPSKGNYLRLHQISDIAISTILVSEDASFFNHSGFDWFELKQSFWLNLNRRAYARGGSTITQQLAKNVYLTADKSILRKIREALLTAQIEKILSKQEILERYLNLIELGPNIYGLRSASNHYFGVEPSEIHLLQAAYIAYLLPNPGERYRTFSDGTLSEYAHERIMEVTHRLYRFKKISESQLTAAKELVGRFPWNDLDTAEVSRLTIPAITEITDVTADIIEEMPEDTPADASHEDQPFNE